MNISVHIWTLASQQHAKQVACQSPGAPAAHLGAVAHARPLLWGWAIWLAHTHIGLCDCRMNEHLL